MKTSPEIALADLVCRRASIEEIYELRFAVLRSGQVPVKLHFPGDADAPPRAWHFGAFVARDKMLKNLACLTLFASTFEDQPAFQLRGMAVADGCRGTGVGSALLCCAEESVRADLRGAGIAHGTRWWCNARGPAIRFYEKNGWRVVSEEFVIENYGPHKRMVREFSS